MLILAIAIAALLAACFRIGLERTRPLDRKELARHRRGAEEQYRAWIYPFE